MELTVLGGAGAWPRVGQACAGYLLQHDDVRVLIDPGYGVMGELLRVCDPADLDAVLVSHGHPDHCADLNPLLRARVLGPRSCPNLPVLAPAGSLDALLAVDPIESVAAAVQVIPADGDTKINFGPLTVEPVEVCHHVTTFGFRISAADGAVLAYTADSGESPDRYQLAWDAGLLLAEVSYPDGCPPEDARYLSDADQVARLALDAGVEHCMITHLMPRSDPFRALALIRSAGFSAVQLARPGVVHRIHPRPGANGLPRRATRKVISLNSGNPRRAASAQS